MTETPAKPLTVTLPIEEVVIVQEGADPFAQAVQALSMVLCPIVHPDGWQDLATAVVCDTCTEVATKACQSDWLTLITAHREQKAAAQVLREAAAQVPSARPLTDKPEPYLRVQAHLEATAKHLGPIEPEPEPEPEAQIVTPDTEAEGLTPQEAAVLYPPDAKQPAKPTRGGR